MTIDKNRKTQLIKKFLFEILFVGVLLVIDLLSKSLIFKFLDEQSGTRFTVWEGIFTLIQAKNYGASFGIFGGKTAFLIVLTVLVTAGVVAFLILRPDTKKSFRIAALSIVAGALGNVVDRIAFGYVRDFIDYTFLKTFFNIDFAIGNIADLFLMFGCILLLVYIVFEYREGDFSGAAKRAALAQEARKKDAEKSDSLQETLDESKVDGDEFSSENRCAEEKESPLSASLNEEQSENDFLSPMSDPNADESERSASSRAQTLQEEQARAVTEAEEEDSETIETDLHREDE